MSPPGRRERQRVPRRKQEDAASVQRRRGGAFLDRAEVQQFIREQAARIAAPDVAALVTDGAALWAKAAALDGDRFDPFRVQIREALDCLDDHASGRCPQIPYHTVSVLAVALFYFQSPVDAVPDFLPKLGAVDDALVMAIAADMAADGLRRYRTWKGTD